MSKQKQLRVSEAVHNELERRKSGDQTYDDVLRELLELAPDFEQLLAYLSDEQADLARTVVSQIHEVGEMNRSIDEEGTAHVVSFTSTNNGRVIAEMEIEQGPSTAEFTVRYRNQRSDLEPIGTVRESEEGVVGGILGSKGRFDSTDEYVDAVQRNVERAYAGWA
jgi:predicted CopG family antitoxin